MTHTTRHHYPGKPHPCRVHEVTCEVCGAKRKSSARPGTDYAPRICSECHNKNQARLMRNFLRRPSPKVSR